MSNTAKHYPGTTADEDIMATCTQCGVELKPGTKFCENCGAKVSVPQPAAQPAAVSRPRFSQPRLYRRPHSLYRLYRLPHRADRR